MAKRYAKPKRWIECPACRAPVAAGYSSCTQCGHGPSSWQLIADAKSLDGTKDMGYTDSNSNSTEGKQDD